MPHYSYVQALQRGIRILYAVAGVEGGLTVNQIANSLQVGRSTAYNLIRTLEVDRLLIRRKNPLRFILGQGLTELKQLDDHRHLLTVSAAVLKKTYAKMPDASFVFCEFEPPYTHERLCVEQQRPGVLVRRRSRQLEPYTRAASLLQLAYSSPEATSVYHNTFPLEKYGQWPWKSREDLERFLSEVRRLGMAAPNFQEYSYGGSGFRVTFPIFSKDNETLGSFGGYFPDTINSKSLNKELIRICRQGAKDVMESL
jgi:DNA-binding IclR family transcriptional regulator